MIKRIQIENFKSIKSLTMELGRFNIFIGENGCGKTNIMEAIAFGGAAAADKLGNEFLSPRGIRVTSPEFMKSAFEPKTKDKPINLMFANEEEQEASFSLISEKGEDKIFSKWIDKAPEQIEKRFVKTLKVKTKENNIKYVLDLLEKESNYDSSREYSGVWKDNHDAIYVKILNFLLSKDLNKKPVLLNLSDFIIYSPENTILRIFKEEGQILPLGIKGQGLFNLISYLLLAKDQGPIEEIKENLKLFDWFEDFKLPKTLAPNEFVLHIKDRFIHSKLKQFDQGSTNEGFLFFLFYLCLFISKDTPSFFAIDNLENSFNPKLCTEITEILVRLSKEKNKQVIVTTHNPSILDGLNLHDDEQRLFVIKRNLDGHTVANRITEKPSSEKPVKLSDVWTRGYIGGLPKTF